jgi:hypothetical protein
LCEPHAFAERAVVGFAIGCVQHGDRVPASDAYWHVGNGLHCVLRLGGKRGEEALW